MSYHDAKTHPISYDELLIECQTQCPACRGTLHFEEGTEFQFCHRIRAGSTKTCDTRIHHPVKTLCDEFEQKDTASIMLKLDDMYPRDRTAKIVESLGADPHLLYIRYALAARYVLQNRNQEEIVQQALKMI